jgi:hypothetical protein
MLSIPPKSELHSWKDKLIFINGYKMGGHWPGVSKIFESVVQGAGYRCVSKKVRVGTGQFLK